MALRGVWEMMLRLWLSWARQWVTSMEACCLFQKHGLYCAGKGQPGSAPGRIRRIWGWLLHC